MSVANEENAVKMSDKSFREAIRRSVAHAEPKKDLIDRIEELEAINKELEEKLLSATMDGYDMAKYEYRDRIEELEAKLAKAVEALSAIDQYGSDTLSGRADGPDDRSWQREGALEMTRRARATLSRTERTER